MGGVTSLAIVGLLGHALLGLMRTGSRHSSWVVNLPTISGLGAVGLFLVFLIASWGGAVSLVWFYLVAAGCAFGYFWMVRRNPARSTPSSHYSFRGWEGWAVLFLSAVVLCTTLIVVLLPLLDWESRILWALKSQVLTAEPSLSSEFFRDPYRLHIHPRYPVLVPFLASWMARHQGGFTETGYQILVCLCASLTLWQLLVLLWRQVEHWLALGVTSMMAVSGVWLNTLYASGVEIVLCFFGILAFSSLCDWQESRQNGDLVLAGIFCFGAAMTKNEGVLLGVVLLLALFLCEVRARGVLPALRLLILPAGVAMFMAFFWIAQLAQIPAVSDEHYLLRLTPNVMAHGIGRLPEIWLAIAKKVARFSQWHLLWLILLWLPVALWKEGGHIAQRLAAWTAILYLAGILLVYVISPWHDIGMHVDVTFDRVALPLLPLFLLVIAYAGAKSEKGADGRSCHD